MQTGDGLLVRLRPTRIGLRPADYLAMAQLAAATGNGLLEVTARGNLQIRGLREETVPTLAAELDDAGITYHQGVAVETPPLSGIDPEEAANAEPLAAAIRAAITAEGAGLTLAPKLSIVVDGGGHLNLSDIVADIRLDAVSSGSGLTWRVAVGGDATSARVVGDVDDGVAVAAVLEILRELHRRGASARGRELDPQALRTRLDLKSPTPKVSVYLRSASPVGRHMIGANLVLGIGLAYGQSSAHHLEALVRGLQSLGATEIRLAPHRALLVLGLTHETIDRAAAVADREGFWTRADEPGNAIAVCAGSTGCASGQFDTKAAADLFTSHAAELLDGAMTVHISGCAKGCAHPQAAPLALCGRADGVGLVVDGRAGDEALAIIPTHLLGSAFDQIGLLLRQQRQDSETARQTLERIGASALATAFHQGSK